MEAGNLEEVRKHVRVYITVFVALGILTGVTVGASYLNVSTASTVIIALIIATIKGSLVACYFMHLISEKKTIFALLILSAFFLIVMLLLPVLSGGEMVISHVS